MTTSTMIGILGLVSVAACWSLAVVLFRVSTAGSVARKLSVLLVIEGMTLATAGFPEFTLGLMQLYYGNDYPNLGLFLVYIHIFSDVAMIALYPPFLARALNTRLTRPFAIKRVQIGFAIGSVMLWLGVILTQSPFMITLLYVTVTLLFVYALVVSIHAWLTTNPGIKRKRAGIFALAFGVRDVGWTLSYGIGAWLMWTQGHSSGMPDIAWFGKTVYALGTLLAVPLIAYGVLRTQLFDIDLKIRWTIKQSTLAGIIIAIVFAISEGASQFLSDELGAIPGLLAAAVVMFFLAPLQRFAENVASKAMPNTSNTPEYAAHRKMQVYEAAVAEALPDGNISERERVLLNSLRDSLGILPVDAEALERELRERSFSAG